MRLFKYQGAGNDFLVIDNRNGAVSVSEEGSLVCGDRHVSISDICDRRYGVGADGVMLLGSGSGCDFSMTYFNSDGSGGMMCGNGGRCIVAFAADLGISHFDFIAADGFHSAEITGAEGPARTVRLRMKDVCSVDSCMGGFFLDTGTRHFVKFSSKISDIDVFNEGRKIRYMDEFAPVGTNVNFVEQNGLFLKVRTYEKGVEDETYACGTGIVASSVAAFGRLSASDIAEARAEGRVRFDVKALRDRLAVDFVPGCTPEDPVASDVWLTGPAVRVAEIIF